MNPTLALVALGVLALIQNASFTAVSRSRNSADVWNHARWSLASNGIWFLCQVFISSTVWTATTTGSYWTLAAAAVVYVVATTIGSCLMMWWLLKTETGKRRVGATK